MNGRLNLFGRVFICVLAYFYSVTAFADYPARTNNATWAGTTYESFYAFCVKNPPSGGTNLRVKERNKDFYFECIYTTPTIPEYKYRGMGFTCSGLGNGTPIYGSLPPMCAADRPVCVPPQILNPSNTACIDPPKDCTDKKGRLINAAANDQGQICVEQCRANPIKIVQQCPNGGLCLGGWAGQYRYDGVRCNGSEISVPPHDFTDNPEQLTEGLKDKMNPFLCHEKGMSSGTVNGQTICIPNNGQGDQSSKETGTTTVTNPDGSTTITTTTTTTTESGGKVVSTVDTQVETKDKNGNTTGKASSTATKDEDKDGFCKKNPNDDKCKKATIDASCDKPFKCTGDVITCEATRVGFLSFCAGEKQREKQELDLLEFQKSDPYTTGLEIIDGKKDAETKEELGVTGDKYTIDLTDAIKTNGFLSCGNLSDKSFSVFGKSFVIPFSQMNYWLTLMGKIAVLFTLVVAARIIIGGKR